MSNATTSVPRRSKRRSIPRSRDVFLSDFLGALSGTPLEWLLGWEAIAERERVARNIEAARAAQAAAQVAV